MTKGKKKVVSFRVSNGKPFCFTQAQWNEWMSQNKRFPVPKADGFCTDCTPDFKAEQMAKGTCAWPCVEFHEGEDGFVNGYRMSLREVAA